MVKEAKPSKQNRDTSSQSTPILVNAQFIRDLSFEAPKMPEVLAEMQENQPNININVNVTTKQFEENIFEVTLSIDSKAMVGENIGFMIELEYCGIFTINAEPESIKPIVLIECPRLLFPFARSVLAQVTRDAGFPPLMLGTVDFADMFQKELARQGENPPKPISS